MVGLCGFSGSGVLHWCSRVVLGGSGMVLGVFGGSGMLPWWTYVVLVVLGCFRVDCRVVLGGSGLLL